MPDEEYRWLDMREVRRRLMVGEKLFYRLRSDHPEELEPRGRLGRKLIWTEAQVREFQDKVLAGEVSV